MSVFLNTGYIVLSHTKMLAVVTGIPGSGKTTVSSKALEVLSKKGVDYKSIVYGTVMFEIAREHGVEDRDDMRKLDLEVQRSIQEKAAHRIAEEAKDSNIVLDTHCTISTPRGYIPGLPEWVLRALKPDVLILVESNPDEIVPRREGDSSRVRDAEDAADLKLHQDLNRNAAMAYATLTGCAVKIIENKQGDLDYAVNEMVATLSE